MLLILDVIVKLAFLLSNLHGLLLIDYFLKCQLIPLNTQHRNLVLKKYSHLQSLLFQCIGLIDFVEVL